MRNVCVGTYIHVEITSVHFRINTFAAGGETDVVWDMAKPGPLVQLLLIILSRKHFTGWKHCMGVSRTVSAQGETRDFRSGGRACACFLHLGRSGIGRKVARGHAGGSFAEANFAAEEKHHDRIYLSCMMARYFLPTLFFTTWNWWKVIASMSYDLPEMRIQPGQQAEELTISYSASCSCFAVSTVCVCVCFFFCSSAITEESNLNSLGCNTALINYPSNILIDTRICKFAFIHAAVTILCIRFCFTTKYRA